MTNDRESGTHSYQINCQQFNSEYRSWQRNSAAQEHALGVRTLGFEHIWITGEEATQVVAAIQTVLIGGLAAAVAFMIARAIS